MVDLYGPGRVAYDVAGHVNSVDASQIVIPLLAAAGTSALATPLVARMARASGFVDSPDERKVHARADMPLLGGLAVVAGVCVGIGIGLLMVGSAVSTDRIPGGIAGGIALLALGVYDDRVGLGALPKLAVQVAAAAVAFHYGFRIDHIREPFTAQIFELPIWLSFAATTLWIVAVTNATNLIDGLDGLATGLGAIIAATLTLICWQVGEMAGVIGGVALVGALLGFLPYNFYPARIFLGDTGSLFIGFTLALLALEGYRKTELLTFVIPPMALAVPLLDTGVSVLRRFRAGKPIFGADRLHMHHRLLRSEGSHRRAVLALYFLTACFCVLAVSLTQLQGYWAILLLLAVGVLTVRLLKNLGVLSSPADEGGLGRSPK